MRNAEHWPSLVDQIDEDMQVSESDYYAADRARDIAAAFCHHANTSIEHGSPNPNGACAEYVVCHDCGAHNPTGKYGSVL